VLFAAANDGSRVLPSPGAKARCPSCKRPVYARCGKVKVWHWAHRGDRACARNSKGETFWHLAWKLRVPPQAREVPRGGLRADIVGRHGRVVELQHSRIDPRVVDYREETYGDMAWLFDSAMFAKYLFVDAIEPSAQGEGGLAWCALRWPRPWPGIVRAKRAVYIDLDPVMPGLVFQLDSVRSSANRQHLAGRLYPQRDLVSWWLYPDYVPEQLMLPSEAFHRVRILSGRRPFGRDLRHYVARKKGVAAWVTDDSLVQWHHLSEVTGDWLQAALLLVADQDIIVVIPRAVRGDVAELDGFQPPAMSQAEALDKRVFLWWRGSWFLPKAPAAWDAEVYDEEDWGVACENSDDQLLRGLVKVEPWRWGR
jgi:hypothetical protein